MARDRKPKRYGRLSRTGHTSHGSQSPTSGSGSHAGQPHVPPPAHDDSGYRPTRQFPAQQPPTDQYRRPATSEYPTDQYRRPANDDFGPAEHYRGSTQPREDDYPTEVHPRRPDPRYDRGYNDRSYPDPSYTDPRDPRYADPRHPDARYADPRDPRYADPRYADPRYADPRYTDPRYPGDTAQGSQGATTAGGAAVVLGKAALHGTNRAARAVTNKVITASKARGAAESGLTPLIWNQVLSYGTDAMITVSLAGTVFFGASSHAQRGNVLLYLLITMAPFALIAPIIGPALDRLQHGRRWTMAFTGIGRAILALVMAAHSTDLLVLYPCALGSLVLSKAYGVVRAAAAPRLVPRGMTLTEANARLTIFGLGSTLVLGGLVGVLIKVTGSYSVGLVVTAIGFAACAFFAFSLPKQVDSAQAAPRHPEEPARPRAQRKVPPMTRLSSWARRGFDPQVVIALQGESALRLLSGMLTIYLAFYIESTSHGLTGVLQLGLVVGAAGVGNFLGTAIGTRLPMERPELIVVISTIVSGVVCLLVALAFSPVLAAVGLLVGSVGNALSKIALDALIQRDVAETLRSSAFGKSETFLQLAWVIGAALGVVIPSHDGDGPIGFIVAGAILVGVGILITLRRRAMMSATARHDWTDRPDAPGSVVPRSVD